MKNFSLILPTRGRAFLIRRLFDSIIETASNTDMLEIILCVDEDDAENGKIDHTLLDIRKIVMPRSSMGVIFHDCYKPAASKYAILMNDDVIFRTKNWDVRILEAFSHFPDDLALVYLNDLYYGKKLSCFPAISRTTFDLMGGICPLEYKSHGIDSHLFDIFKRLSVLGYERRKYLPDVVLEHMHYGVSAVSYEDNIFEADHASDISLYWSLSQQRQQTALKMAEYIQSHSDKTPASPRPTVSIIMRASGSLSKSAIACLEAVYEDNKFRYLDYEIIVASDGIVKKKNLLSLPKDLRGKIILVCGGNAAEVMRKAAAVAKKGYLVFINDRCLPRCGWLESLVESAQGGDVGIVGSKCVNPRNGRVEHIGVAFFKDNTATKGTCLYKGLPSIHQAVEKAREFQAVKMPGMLVKKDVFLQIEKFEYLDLCLKVRRLGKKVVYAPQAGLYYDGIVADAADSINLKNLPPELIDGIECDLGTKLFEDGFKLCSASQGRYICLFGENE